jgi:mono/diheme cytochrome c family protein
MLRTGILACTLSAVLLLAATGSASAETAIERGDYLVNTIMACGNCHSPRDAEGKFIAGRALSGGLTFDTPDFLATAANITPDAATGIGSWNDEEIRRALVEGVRPNHGKLSGVALAAIMPANFYKALLPDDLAAVIAYLRSVKPVRNEVPQPLYRLPIHREPYPDAEAGFTAAMMADSAKHGAYLATIGHCMECHAAWSRGVQDYRSGLGKGGRAFPLREGVPDSPTSIAANITSHPTSGLGAWSDAEIGRAITQGIGRDGHALKPAMAYGFYAALKEKDRKDLIVYLRTVPPLE